MPKSRSSQIARKAQSMKGCIDIMISENALDDELQKICSDMYDDLKRDVFLSDKIPQLSAFCLLWEVLRLYYDSIPVSREQLVQPVVRYSILEVGDIAKTGTTKDVFEFQERVRKVFTSKTKSKKDIPEEQRISFGNP